MLSETRLMNILRNMSLCIHVKVLQELEFILSQKVCVLMTWRLLPDYSPELLCQSTLHQQSTENVFFLILLPITLCYQLFDLCLSDWWEKKHWNFDLHFTYFEWGQASYCRFNIFFLFLFFAHFLAGVLYSLRKLASC